MFNNYIIKTLDDDEWEIFNKYFPCSKLGMSNYPTFLYMENITITTQNLIECKNIYLIGINPKSANIFDYFNYDKCNINEICKIDRRFQYYYLGKEYELAITIHTNLKKIFQDIFAILYYIFPYHNNVYLPELSKHIFMMYFTMLPTPKIEF